VQQVPTGGQHHRRRVELAGKLAAGGHTGRSPAPGVPQVPGGVAERVPRGEAGLAPCGQRRAGAGLHAARNCGDVLQVAAHHSDHVQQAVGNFLNVLAAAIGLVACYSGAGVVAGRRQEVAERGPHGHGPVLSSPQMSRALWAACRHAYRSPVSSPAAAACVRRSATRRLSPATTLATRSGRLTGPGLLFGRRGEQRVPGQRGCEGQGVAAVRGGCGGHHERGEQAAGRVLNGMDHRHHPLERRIGRVQDGGQAVGFLQALPRRVDYGHLPSSIRRFTRIIAPPPASSAAQRTSAEKTPRLNLGCA